MRIPPDRPLLRVGVDARLCRHRRRAAYDVRPCESGGAWTRHASAATAAASLLKPAFDTIVQSTIAASGSRDVVSLCRVQYCRAMDATRDSCTAREYLWRERAPQPRRMDMTTFTWTGGSGNWDTASDWNPLGPPTASSLAASAGPRLRLSRSTSPNSRNDGHPRQPECVHRDRRRGRSEADRC